LFLIIGSAFLLAGKVTHLRSFKAIPLDKLYSEKALYEHQLEGFEGDLGETYEEQENLKELRSNLVSVNIEVFLKKFKIDYLAIVLILVAVLGLFFSKFNMLFKKRQLSRDSVIEDIEIEEDAPKEFYVDEWEFNQRTEGGFKSKVEAVDWIKSDPLLKCDYCGARLRSTLTGKREAVQLVTFYKKVPEGAKDLRVVLGSFWFTNAATELKCPGCQRVVKR